MKKVIVVFLLLLPIHLWASDALNSISWSWDGRGSDGFKGGSFSSAQPEIVVDSRTICKIKFLNVNRRLHKGVKYIDQEAEISCFKDGAEESGASFSCGLCERPGRKEVLEKFSDDYTFKLYCNESYSNCH